MEEINTNLEMQNDNQIKEEQNELSNDSIKEGTGENKILNFEDDNNEEKEEEENEGGEVEDNKKNNNNSIEALKNNLHVNNESDVDSEEEEEENEEKKIENSGENESKQYFDIRESKCDDIIEEYEKLREYLKKTNKKWEDKDFGEENTPFTKNDDDNENENFKIDTKYKYEYIKIEDDKAPFFLVEPGAKNLNYEFKIKKGQIQDKFFLGAFLMLFRRREEYFQNLILDYENIKENINLGFCGFTFFIDGEWKNVTIDTRVHRQGDDLALSNIETQNAYWMCLFEKAYAKAFKSYEVIKGSLINDYLVDLTGGYARNITINSNKNGEIKEAKKKSLFEEIEKYLQQGYLIGCMKYDESTKDEECASEKSEDGVDEDQIVSNCIYNILDVNMDNSNRIIYLVNYWGKGKWTGSYSVEDETWEANKALADRLNYTVSQSDGTFWMTLDDFLMNFNKIYYCRIFPEKWSQFCIEGKWANDTSGGAPPKILPWYPEKFEKPNENKGYQSQISKVSNNNFNNALDKSFGMKKARALTNSEIKGGFKNKLGQSDEFGGKGINMKSSNKLAGVIDNNKLKRPSKNVVLPTIKSSTLPTQKTAYTVGNKTLTTTGNDINNKKINKKKVKREPRFKKELFKRNIITDTEDRWFLNPQYKIEIESGTKMIISLMQRDAKLNNNIYLKVCFYIIYCKGKFSRVWEIKPENIIKIAQEEKENGREIIMNLDYFEILRKVNEIRKKKLQRGEKIQLNLIPFIDYNTKYEVEKKKQNKNIILFKPYEIKSDFWFRIFSSNPIYIAELPKPYECSIKSQWSMENIYTTGGARFITEGRLRENSKWPINPQFLLSFDKCIQMKMILRKTTGWFSIEANKIGILLCKPDFKEEEGFDKKQKTTSNAFHSTEGLGVKIEQIKRVMESTARILDNKQRNKIDQIYPKMMINSSEWNAESSYSNQYSASLFLKFNKIDSPIIIIPTLDNCDTPFEFELIIYSNKEATITPLNNDYCKLLVGEWKDNLNGGSHLTQDEKKKNNKDNNFGLGMVRKELTWYDNPKYHLSFNNNNSNVEFEIVLTRFESIWKPIIAKGIVNSMIGIYVFEYNQMKWKEKCINKENIEFLPKNTISISFNFSNCDSRGFIIMPVTYGSGIKGPFLIMVKCKEPFTFKQLDDKFK